MPEITIPLAGPRQERIGTTLLKDQRFINCFIELDGNRATKSTALYCVKRPGLELAATVGGSDGGLTGYVSIYTGKMVTIFTGANTTVWHGTVTGAGTNCGNLDTIAYHISENLYNNIVVYFITTNLGTAWYLPEDSVSAAATFTGDTHTNTTIDNITGAAGVYIGQLLSGTNIAANTRVLTRSPDTTTPTSITTTVATTGTTAGVTITRTNLAKMTGVITNFPALVSGKMQAIDGFLLAAVVAAGSGRINNSGLNTFSTWGLNDWLPVDTAIALAQLKGTVICFGSGSSEFAFNAGNPSNSILSKNKQLYTQVGMRSGTIPYAIHKDKVYWCANTSGDNTVIYEVDSSNSPKPISSQDITRLFGTNTYFVCAVELFGGTYVIATNSSGADGGCYAYCVETGIWTEWAFNGTSVTFDMFSHTLGTYWIGGGTLSGVGGKVFKINTSSGLLGSAVYQDNGSTLTMTIQTEPKVLNKGRGFVINSIELLADNQSSGSTTLEISRDDYASFQTLGSFDLTQRRKRIMRGGLCRNHAIFRLTDSGNNAWRGQAIIVDYTPCNT